MCFVKHCHQSSVAVYKPQLTIPVLDNIIFQYMHSSGFRTIPCIDHKCRYEYCYEVPHRNTTFAEYYNPVFAKYKNSIFCKYHADISKCSQCDSSSELLIVNTTIRKQVLIVENKNTIFLCKKCICKNNNCGNTKFKRCLCEDHFNRVKCVKCDNINTSKRGESLLCSNHRCRVGLLTYDDHFVDESDSGSDSEITLADLPKIIGKLKKKVKILDSIIPCPNPTENGICHFHSNLENISRVEKNAANI